LIATDLNSITREGMSSNIDFKRLSFFINNLWIVQIMKWLRLTYILRVEVAAINLKVKKKVDFFKWFVEALVSSPPPQQELNKQMQYFKEQIDILSELKEMVEKVLTFSSHKVLGDFETTDKLMTDLLEMYFKILLIYKKLNIKSPIPTTQLAKDAATHSISTLREILNGN
jgi:hypothetical protein